MTPTAGVFGRPLDSTTSSLPASNTPGLKTVVSRTNDPTRLGSSLLDEASAARRPSADRLSALTNDRLRSVIRGGIAARKDAGRVLLRIGVKTAFRSKCSLGVLSGSGAMERSKGAVMGAEGAGTISHAERDLRQRVVSDAAHSSAMAGLEASPEYRADAAAYVAGEIDEDELGRRTRAATVLPEIVGPFLDTDSRTCGTGCV